MPRVGFRGRIIEVENLIVGLVIGTWPEPKEVKGWKGFRAILVLVPKLAASFLLFALGVVVWVVEYNCYS